MSNSFSETKIKSMYTLLGATSHVSLELLVNRWIEDGWEPLGGVAVENVNGATYFYQAMFDVKLVNENE